MQNDLLYRERLTSNKTEALFITLTIAFLLLALWRMNERGMEGLAIVFTAFSVIFLFYCINYRTLIIELAQDTLKLKFGVFTWRVPLENVGDGALDELPAFLKYGGAGIHFMTVRGRYRASFNFLEHPRVVVAFKKKRGLVRDLSFSTRQPQEVLRMLHERTTGKIPANRVD